VGSSEQLLIWSDGRGLIDAGPIDPVPEQAPLLVADSWLVRDGRVRALDLHGQRFAAGCAEIASVSMETVAAFWAAVVERMPPEGHWFPRVELASVPRGRLALRIRPAPSRTEQVRVWVPDVSDPRRIPRRKGPDLGVLADLRRAATAAGADEALLRSPDGFLIEAANSSLLWWDDDTLCVPSPKLPSLRGITTRLIQERALEHDIAVRHSHCQLESLASREVWLVNALHGIRAVTAWVGADLAPGPDGHSLEWRKWLEALSEPVVSTKPSGHAVI
jgi:branched-subunit amino acid aminotransferase/4-amino-4-deoxychorismate lyase